MLELLGSSATVVAIIAVCVTIVTLAALRAGRRMAVQWKNLQVTLEGVNAAVNHKPPDEPTLYQHAAQLREEVRELHDVMAEHLVQDASNFGGVRVTLERIERRLSAVESP